MILFYSYLKSDPTWLEVCFVLTRYLKSTSCQALLADLFNINENGYSAIRDQCLTLIYYLFANLWKCSRAYWRQISKNTAYLSVQMRLGIFSEVSLRSSFRTIFLFYHFSSQSNFEVFVQKKICQFTKHMSGNMTIRRACVSRSACSQCSTVKKTYPTSWENDFIV